MTKVVFHIGHHKTGTTWLQNSYFQQTEVFNLLNNTQQPWRDVLCKKIIRSEKFDSQGCREIIKEREKANKINVLSAERLSGHPISGGYDASKIAGRLHQINPNAKIIITVRDPESFIISVYKQMIREGYCGNFENFLQDENWKTTKTSSIYFMQEEIVSRYRELFGMENVLLLNFGEFLNDKKKFLHRIEEFLEMGIKMEEYSLGKKINKSFAVNRLKALRDLNRVRRTEFNPFPIINIGTNTVRRLSQLFGIFYTKTDLIKFDVLQKYLTQK